jgi:excisionase family DNA binding protein
MTSHRRPKNPPEPVESDIQDPLFDVEPYRVLPSLDSPGPAAADAWLTSEALAARLSVPFRYVRSQAAAHRWPAHKVGQEWRFSPDDVAVIDGMLRRPR